MLVYKKLIESAAPTPSLFERALIEIQAHNNLYSITMQFHWRLADAISAVMWFGNIDEMYIISYCPKLSNVTLYGDTAFQGYNLKINVFQNIKLKKFVNDNSYYLCVFVFYVYILEVQVWKQELRWNCDYIKR